ncbi:MAG: family 16 glycoside hydrolase [Planctomycetota bacterium]|jgi:acetyl esterase/lipase
MKRFAIVLTAVLLVLASGTVLRAQETTKSRAVTYKTVGDRELKIHLHFPPGWKTTDRRPAIIFFFGGGWTGGTTGQFEFQADYLAGRGMVAARADYRVKSRDGVTPDKCVEDARSAVRWMRKNSRRLGIDPGKLIASGGSAGGHLAACTMIADSVEAEGDDLSISTIPQAMVLFNPVLSFEHDQMLTRLGDNKHLARKISPTAHLDKKSPPALIIFGTNDRLKAFGDAYWEKAEKVGARADKFLAPDQPHGFFNRSPWQERTLIAADKFLASLGYLRGAPTIEAPSGKTTAQAASADRPGRQNRNRTDVVTRSLRMDKNDDGKISSDEAQGQLKKNFDRVDTDDDGFISRRELEELAKRLQRGRAGSSRNRVHPNVGNWESLFAADLSNAIYAKGVWTVEDGVLTASEDKAIWTNRDYDNFVLDLEFKTASGTNSGVVVYCSDMKNWIPNSVEIQIADDFAEKWATSPKTWQCGAIFGRLAPSKSAVKKPGQWNRFTVTCRDQNIDVALNGARVASMDMSLWTSAKTNPDGSEIPPWLNKPLSEAATKGRIGLQGKHAGAPIWFRNIKIRELP